MDFKKLSISNIKKSIESPIFENRSIIFFMDYSLQQKFIIDNYLKNTIEDPRRQNHCSKQL